MPLPDEELHMQQVQQLAQEAREKPFEAALAAARPPGVIAPIYMGASPVIPDRYVVHYSITRCSNCAAESRDNEFYALSYLKSRVNGTRVKHLTRCDRPEYNLPVDVIPTGTHKVPFCCECARIDLSHLPPPPSASRLYDLEEPRLKGAKPKADAKKPKSQPTADDLA